jgi:hypothetical protein
MQAIPHAVAKCGWCGGPFYKIDKFYWCRSERCAALQRAYGVGVNTANGWKWLYVPLPNQVDLEAAGAPYRLHGGAAGPGKSTGARWLLYKLAMRVKNFEALLLRRTFPELEKTHLRRMQREETILRDHGIDCEYKKADRQMLFHSTGAIIEAGHLEDEAAVERYLSTEYDAIVADEGGGFPPTALLELSTRAVGRSDRPEMAEVGGPFFLVVTNPIGPAVAVLRDFFILHLPDWETFPHLKERYNPAEWRFTPAKLEDNPYLNANYETSLAILGKTRFRQLRHGDWSAIEGAFFERWAETRDGRPHHVRRVPIDGRRALWFRSLDWGRVKPGCCLWWAVLPDFHYHIAAEYKFQGQSPTQVARAILERDKALGIERVLYTAADPALFIRLQDDGTSIADAMAKAGVRLRDRISNSRVNGWARVDELFTDDPQGNPWLTVDPTCKYFRRSVPLLQKDKNEAEDVDTSGDDHAGDACRYGAMSRPPIPTYVRDAPPPGSVGAIAEEMRAAIQEDPQN